MQILNCALLALTPALEVLDSSCRRRWGSCMQAQPRLEKVCSNPHEAGVYWLQVLDETYVQYCCLQHGFTI